MSLQMFTIHCLYSGADANRLSDSEVDGAGLKVQGSPESLLSILMR